VATIMSSLEGGGVSRHPLGALGLHSSGMLTMQGVGVALAGVIAQQTSPSVAMAVLAAVSVTVTLTLAPGLRARPQPAAVR
jgi:hypothetical protein